MDNIVWGTYAWFVEYGTEMIHEDDRSRFEKLQPYGKLFKRKINNEMYIELVYRDESYRVRPTLFTLRPTPKFDFMDEIRVVGKEDFTGVIHDINWHNKLEKEIYYIIVYDKVLKTRFFAENLASA